MSPDPPSRTCSSSPRADGKSSNFNLQSIKEIEVILATNPTMEGEATALYIKKKLQTSNSNLQITRIGSGLPMGADLEFADQATLSRAMDGRTTL